MYLIRICFIIGGLFMLSACNMNNANEGALEPTGNRDLELVKLSSEGVADQNPSNQAKELLSNHEEVTGVRAVNHDKELLVAVDVAHHERFGLDNIEKKLRKKTKKNFSNLNVTLSTDQKILLELEQLEKAIQEKNISNKELQKRIEKLKKLSKAET